MRLEYNVTGEDRKRLVAAISDILGVKPRYTGVPKCAFVIGFASVDREGSVTFDDAADHAAVEDLVTRLVEKGFTRTTSSQEKDAATAAAPTPLEKGAEKEVAGTTISVPRALFTDLSLNNLRKMVRVKEPLLRKAFATDRVEIEVTEETVGFPWFGELDAEELKSYTQFIEKLCRFAITSKRITSKERRLDDERFTMRTWLIRLGCSGDEYKALRKRMLENLTGDAAWRFGRPS